MGCSVDNSELAGDVVGEFVGEEVGTEVLGFSVGGTEGPDVIGKEVWETDGVCVGAGVGDAENTIAKVSQRSSLSARRVVLWQVMQYRRPLAVSTGVHANARQPSVARQAS